MSELGQRLIYIVREKAAANPDFVYDGAGGCVYMDRGQPSCIIGHALFGAGLITSCIPGTRNTAAFGPVALYLGLGLDESEEKWLRKVQKLQDTGWTWGGAVHRTDELAGINA